MLDEIPSRVQDGGDLGLPSRKHRIRWNQPQNSLSTPADREQEVIASALRDYETREEEETEYLAKLKLLKKGLMEDLLTGRVRVNVEGEQS